MRYLCSRLHVLIQADGVMADRRIEQAMRLMRDKKKVTPSAVESCNEAGVLKAGQKRSRAATKRFTGMVPLTTGEFKNHPDICNNK